MEKLIKAVITSGLILFSLGLMIIPGNQVKVEGREYDFTTYMIFYDDEFNEITTSGCECTIKSISTEDYTTFNTITEDGLEIDTSQISWWDGEELVSINPQYSTPSWEYQFPCYTADLTTTFDIEEVLACGRLIYFDSSNVEDFTVGIKYGCYWDSVATQHVKMATYQHNTLNKDLDAEYTVTFPSGASSTIDIGCMASARVPPEGQSLVDGKIYRFQVRWKMELQKKNLLGQFVPVETYYYPSISTYITLDEINLYDEDDSNDVAIYDPAMLIHINKNDPNEGPRYYWIELSCTSLIDFKTNPNDSWTSTNVNDPAALLIPIHAVLS